MANTTTRPPASGPPSAQAPKPQPKWVRWITIIAGIIIGIGGVTKLVNAFTLPACDAERIAEVLKSIYKEQKVEITMLSDFKSLTSTSSERTCQVHAETPVDQATIDYRIFWDGWTAKIEARAQQK
jgi:hypothetical protein